MATCCGDEKAPPLSKLSDDEMAALPAMEVKHLASYPDNRAGRRAYEREAAKRRKHCRPT